MWRMLLGIGMVLAVLVTPPVKAQDDDVQSRLEAAVADYAAADGPAVVVQVTSPAGTWTVATGLADGDRPAVAEDRFRIASMSKTFVAVVALMLYEEGALDLEARAADYVADELVAHIPNLDTVTVRQLLTMRSGIPDYLESDEFWAAVQAEPTYEWTAEAALALIFDAAPMFAPGEAFYYSNSNYVLMQLVLEEAAGMPLHELVRERILDPLEMRNTYTQIREELPGGFVNGYADFDGDGVAEDVTTLNDGAGLGDGALVSNAADLTTFYRALLQEQSLLSAAMLEILLTFEEVEGFGYSMGLYQAETELGIGWGHSGAVVGFISNGAYVPGEKLIVIVLAAGDEIPLEDIVFAAVEAVLE